MNEASLSTEPCPPGWLWALLAVPALGMAFTFVVPLFPRSEPFVCLPCVTIYVRLPHEGTDVWRPAQARELAPMVYELLAREDPDSVDEEWEFAPGTVVRCEERELSGGRCRVAVARADLRASEPQATHR